MTREEGNQKERRTRCTKKKDIRWMNRVIEGKEKECGQSKIAGTETKGERREWNSGRKGKEKYHEKICWWKKGGEKERRISENIEKNS